MTVQPRTALQLLVTGDAACFRRPEFKEDLVSYDVLPPLHAWRLVDRVVGGQTPCWVTRISVLEPIRTDLMRVETKLGTRRALALRHVRYLLDILVGGSAAENDGASSSRIADVALHLGLADHPATIERVEGSTDVGEPIELTTDLGWLPCWFDPAEKRTNYRRLSLELGVLDLNVQDGETIAT